MEIKTILIPVDGSEPAENAFRYGVGLAEENEATIVLLHVLDANETYYATNRVMLAGGMLDERKETAQRVMDQMKSQVPEGITCKQSLQPASQVKQRAALQKKKMLI